MNERNCRLEAKSTKSRVQFIRPVLPSVEEWEVYLREAYAQSCFTNFGPVNAHFEKALTEYFNFGRDAITVSNGTSGLIAALHELGIKGNVAIPSFTFVATAQAVLAAGCNPVFCDIDETTLELCPGALASLLQTQDIATVISVRAYGFDRDQGDIVELASQFGVPVVVDAAAALGPGTVFVGRQGAMEVFSLHATKVFGIGEGGVIFAPKNLGPGLREATNFGIRQTVPYGIGLNAKMSEFQAAVGLAVLDRIDEFVRHRRSIAAVYHREFSKCSLVDRCWPESQAVWQTYPLLLREGVDVPAVIAEADRSGIGLRRYYFPALHTVPVFKQYAYTELTVTENVHGRVLCLPVYSDMTDSEVQDVVDVMRCILSSPT